MVSGEKPVNNPDILSLFRFAMLAVCTAARTIAAAGNAVTLHMANSKKHTHSQSQNNDQIHYTNPINSPTVRISNAAIHAIRH